MNGRLPDSDLSRIPEGRLERNAAAAWNTMRLFIWRRFKVDIRPAGPRSSYRTYRWQVFFWNNQPPTAAYPGTSNHGWGKAVDVATQLMASLISRVMHLFGWSHDEGARVGEWWHFTYVGGFRQPNPGTSRKYPVMRHGSGGPGQAPYVREVQKRLRRHGFPKLRVDGNFGRLTAGAVRTFQKRHDLKADGIVGRTTWRALRRAPRRS